MAVTFDAVGPTGGGGAESGAATSLSWTHTVAANSTVVAGISIDIATDTGITATMTCGGTSMTSIGRAESGAGTSGFGQLFVLSGVASGTPTLTINISGGTPDVLAGGSISLVGAVQTTASCFTNSKTSTTASATTSSNTLSSSMCVGVVAAGNTVSSATSPSTSRYINNTAGNAANKAGDVGGATSPGTGSTVTMAWTTTASTNCVVMTEIVAPAAATSPVIPLVHMTNTHRKGVIKLLRGNPGLTPSVPRVLVNPTNTHRKGAVKLLRGNPGLTPTSPPPIVVPEPSTIRQSHGRKGFIKLLRGNPGLTPTSPPPLVVPPPFTARQSHGRKGFIKFLQGNPGLTPSSPEPLVHTTNTHRRGVIQIIKAFVAPPPPATTSPQPLVRTRPFRRPGRTILVTGQPGLTPVSPSPIVRSRRTIRAGLIRLIQGFRPPKPPPTEWAATHPQPWWVAGSSRPWWEASRPLPVDWTAGRPLTAWTATQAVVQPLTNGSAYGSGIYGAGLYGFGVTTGGVIAENSGSDWQTGVPRS